MTSVTIPDNVTSIGKQVFFGCRSLKSVTIGNGVTSIDDNAFFGCFNLTSVYCKPKTPPTLGSADAFDNNVPNRNIYVPTASVDAYKTADGWKKYADNIIGYEF